MYKKIRVVLALLCWLGITLFFLDISGVLHHHLGWLTRIQFVPAVMALNFGIVALWVVVTLLLGRCYCSVICPLGVFQDIIAWFGRKFRGKRTRKAPYDYSPAKTWLRWTVLVLFIAAMLVGAGSLVALLAPYSSYGRIAQNLFQPLWTWANNGLAAIAEHYDSYAFYEREVWLRSLPTFLIAAVTLLALIVLAGKNGRTYCNTVCPVGTVLGALSRFAIFKIHIDEDKCVNCKLCQHNCKAACIDIPNKKIDYSRCVDCFNCIGKCNKGAITFGLHKHKPLVTTATAAKPGADKGRRAFLASGAALLATAALKAEEKTVDGGLALVLDKKAPVRVTPLTPPGSQSYDNFTKRCTGCQLCVSECPNDVLRPSTDLMRLMQPEMSYERGHCRPECNRCSEVCPAGAILPVRHEEKASIQIGHAVWIADNCLPLTDGISCGNCARHCPAGAIKMVPSDPDDKDSARIPSVDETRCIGCGACEHLCPARPFSAIYVEGHSVHKIL